jgi:hypothetical protein
MCGFQLKLFARWLFAMRISFIPIVQIHHVLHRITQPPFSLCESLGSIRGNVSCDVVYGFPAVYLNIFHRSGLESWSDMILALRRTIPKRAWSAQLIWTKLIYELVEAHFIVLAFDSLSQEFCDVWSIVSIWWLIPDLISINSCLVSRSGIRSVISS